METKGKKLFNSRPLFYGFLALLLAISTTKFLFDGNVKYIVFVALILCAVAVFCLCSKNLIGMIVILCAFLFGVGWFFVGIHSFQGRTYEMPCQVVGRISDDVSYSKYGNSAVVVLKNVYINGQKEKNIKLTISIDSKEDLKTGDIVAFEAEIQNVKLFTFGKFNSFYYRDGTPYESSVSAENFVFQGQSVHLDEKYRQKVKSTLYANMGEENGAVAYAVLFGDKSEIEDEVYESYKSSGIIHLLTVSGLHISFLINLLGFFLKKCKIGGFLNFFICFAVIGMYAFLCGFSPSVLRAGIMGLVFLAGKLSGKCYDNLNSLGLAGIIILLYSPLFALDYGFLMSFFCVLAIFIIFPWLSKFLKKIFPKFVADAFAVSISAQIGILPFVANMFSSFNFLTFFVNLIVIPLFSVLYPVLFVTAPLCALMPFLGFLLKLCGCGFSFFYGVAGFFGQTRLICNLEPFDVFVTALACIFFFLLSKYFMTNKKVKAVCCSTILVLIALVVPISYLPTTVSSSLSYAYNYSNAVITLTNSQGNSILIDPGYESFTKQFLSVQNIKDVQYAFVLQTTTAKIDTIRKIGVQNIIRCDKLEGYDEEILVTQNEYGQVGGFRFVYLADAGSLVGLEIQFDQTKVLILKNKKLSAEFAEELARKDYDFVLVGKKSENAKLFPEKTQILAYFQDDNIDSSFVRNGNITYKIDGKKIFRRCLD